MPRIKGGGNSGGCQTCRRRKVKCDERHPPCARCENGNRECEGYGRNHRFVDENPRIEHRVKKKGLSNAPNDLSPPPSPDCMQVFKPLDSNSSPGKGLGLSAFEEKIQIAFLFANFLTGTEKNSPWLMLHAKDPSPCAQMSIRALAAVYFGRVHHIHETTVRGFEYYIDALKKLNHSLQQTDDSSSMTVFRSAIVLELYEFIAFDSATGWMKHAGGVGKIIELRGPWKYQNREERHLLESNRVTIALECLVKKKRCFLEHPHWKIIPWAADPVSKTLDFYLHDILCDLPGLFEDATNIELSGLGFTHNQLLHQDLSSKILVLLHSLYEWRAVWQQQNPDSCCEMSTLSPAHGAFSPTVFCYSSLTASYEICFYNAILLLILRLSSQVISPAFDSTFPSLHLVEHLDYGPLLPPGSAANSHAVATEICKSVKFHLSHPASCAVAFFLLFPLRLAYQTFEPESKNANWLRRVMRDIADMSGFEISRSLGGQEFISKS